MLNTIKDFKEKIEEVKETHPLRDKIGKAGLSKLLVMANLAEMCIFSGTRLPVYDREYFERQSAIGRYYNDWGLEWVATDYYKICQYIKVNHW